MNPSYQRALILHEQGRYADAARELRVVLGAEPDHPFAHAMLALCLAHQKDLSQATEEADRAVGLAPHQPFAHYVRAKVLCDRNRLMDAERAIGEAIRLDAHNADYFSLLSAIRFEQERWPDALQAAEQGLAADPEHAGCVNLRAMALVKLNRKAEAGAAIGAALARDPDNAVTHANEGWRLLHLGDHRKALEHFREALRIDPELEWARAGIVEALKARHLVYRLMLGYFLWMGRLGSSAQWGILIGGYVGYQLLGSVAADHPKFAPFIQPLLYAYMAFAVMTWLADPLFNLLLRLNRFGRLVLSRRQTIASNVIGGLLLAAIVALAVWLGGRRDDFRWVLLAAVFGLLTLPTSGAFRVPDGWPRVVMIVACTVLAAAGLAGVGALFLASTVADNLGGALAGLGVLLFRGFTYGILATTIGYNYLRAVRPAK